MKATILIDNITKNDLKAEWGLSIYIEFDGNKILLDGGTTGDFCDNAEKLGIDLNKVDFGALSHAHYDHSDGLERFFKYNENAKIYLRAGIKENCFSQKKYFKKYIGVKKGILKKYKDRFVFVEGDYKIVDGVYIVPHKRDGLEDIARAAGLYVRNGLKMIPDNFKHEQSLVLDTEKGLVIFNSCSHGGADNIIDEIAETFPRKHICCLIGGLHLYKISDEGIVSLTKRINKLGIEKIITGHCTGQHGFEVLKEQLGEKVQQMYTGMEIEI